MGKPIMAKATAVWLVDNTTIGFKQIADFVGMHELEVQGIAEGDVATGVKGFDPIANNQLVQEEIDHHYWDFKITGDLLELRNLAIVALLVVQSALKRRESRGLHYTRDFPEPDPRLIQDTVLKRSMW